MVTLPRPEGTVAVWGEEGEAVRVGWRVSGMTPFGAAPQPGATQTGPAGKGPCCAQVQRCL